MISCPDEFRWSPAKAAQRQSKAEKILGKKVTARLVGFALFLLGADRKETAKHVDISFNTFLSFLTRMNGAGLDGLRDRRQAIVPEQAPAELLTVSTEQLEDGIALCLGIGGNRIVLNDNQMDHKKILLLTFAANGLLSAKEVAELLGYTESYTRTLVRNLSEGDVDAVLDKRTGQRNDYRVTDDVKGELLTQWAVNAVSGGSTSSPALSRDLKERCELEVPARTVRHHLKKLGIVRLGGKVKDLAERAKKNS